MYTIDETWTSAPPEIAFPIAADVENWPSILSHYRWVRFREKKSFGNGVVEMAANRHFGSAPWPTWWLSEMITDEASHTVAYRHIGGITKGMDVLWEVRPTDDGGSHLRIIHEWAGPNWPLIGGIAANFVIGPIFVHHIATRTLAGIRAAAEAAVKA